MKNATMTINMTINMTVTLLLVAFLSPALLWSLTVSATEHADNEDNFGQPVELYDAEQGRLVFSSGDSNDGGLTHYYLAPTLKTAVSMKITGLIARVKVTQQFGNPNQQWLDGVYTFPLPELAAVDHLSMIIGERVIEGQIKEKQQARKIFRQAQREGKKATLIEQHRPNIFSNNVANIGPGESVTVEIEYQQTLHYDQGEFSLRFPMVVAPRYIPGKKVIEGFSGTGWAQNTDEVSDASLITPDTKTANDADEHEVSINIDLQTGFPVALLSSDFHQLNITEVNAQRFQIELDQQKTLANRDFILRFKPEPSNIPQGAFFTQQKGDDNYALLMLLPPYEGVDSSQLLAKEMIFVIDTSGSMHGDSMNQAKEALLSGLHRLKTGDSFNIVQFNSHAYKLFPRAMPATVANINRAQHYVNGLIAEGGTQMDEALQQVLHNSDNVAVIRQVIFITDGSVGNEAALFDIIHQQLGDSRLFTIGIGSAPNSHFMRGAATFGRGTFTYIGAVDQVKTKISALFQKLESPILSDIKIAGLNDQQADYWPDPISDLYLGEPLIVSLKLPLDQQNLTVSGKLAAQNWHMDLPIGRGGKEEGLDVLWARNKIRSLSEQARTPIQRKEVGNEITQLALAHHLVTRYTSLVAVDVTPSKPAHEQSKTKALANHLPDGWTRHQPHGQLPQGATSAPMNLLLGGLLLLLTLLSIRVVPVKFGRGASEC